MEQGPRSSGRSPTRRDGRFWIACSAATGKPSMSSAKSFPEMTRFGVMKHLSVLCRGQSGRRRPARPHEAALPQSRADRASRQPVDQQVRGPLHLRPGGPGRAGGRRQETLNIEKSENRHEPHCARLPDLHRRDTGAGVVGDHRLGVDQPVFPRHRLRRAASSREGLTGRLSPTGGRPSTA